MTEVLIKTDVLVRLDALKSVDTLLHQTVWEPLNKTLYRTNSSHVYYFSSKLLCEALFKQQATDHLHVCFFLSFSFILLRRVGNGTFVLNSILFSNSVGGVFNFLVGQ